MRVGWSDKQAAPVLGLSNATKTAQALNPAVRKIALLWRADTTRTLDMIISAVRELEAEERQRDAMPDAEIELRVRELAGRADR